MTARNSIDRPRVSVVMPTYNCAGYIGEAIQSVIRQSFADWELLIVDDGSTDETPAIVEAFSQRGRLTYCRTTNGGPARARNVGIGLAQGEFVAFLDADDIWIAEKLAKQVAVFEKCPKVGLVYSGRKLMDAHSGELTEEARSMVKGDALAAVVGGFVPPCSSVVVRKEVFERTGAFNENVHLAEDYDLWLRVASCCEFDFVDEPLLIYRTGHANFSTRADERRSLVIERILPEFLGNPQLRERIGERIIREAYSALYLNRALYSRQVRYWSACADCIRGVSAAPWRFRTWSAALKCLVPVALSHAIKGACRTLVRSSTA